MPDFGRRDFRGSGPRPQEPSLDAVRRTDSFIDALAVGGSAVPQDAADAELAALLGSWRDELRWPPATGLLSDSDVTSAFNAGRAQKVTGRQQQRWTDTQRRTRSRRSLSIIGSSAAAVLCIGGFGALVADSSPGDALYGVRTMLFGAPKQVRDDQIGLAAKTELQQVQTLISQGDWEQAQDKLVAVSTQVATIDDQQQKQELLDQFNDLSAKVVERDPAATAPPGVVYTVPPSSVALIPAIEPTGTPSALGSVTTSTNSSSPTTPTTSLTTDTTTSTTSMTTDTPSVTTSAAPPATSSSPATSSTSATSSSSASASASASAAPQSQQTTTLTSAVPTTTTAPAAAPTSGTPAAPTSVGASPDVPRPVSSTAAPAAGSDAGAPASAAPKPAAQSQPASSGESVPLTPITTTPVPGPASG
jgi:hypothetical protein